MKCLNKCGNTVNPQAYKEDSIQLCDPCYVAENTPTSNKLVHATSRDPWVNDACKVEVSGTLH